MSFEKILDEMYADEVGLLPVGIHCSTDRKNEYGTALTSIIKEGRQGRLYTRFILEELLPLYPERIQHPLFFCKIICRIFPGRIESHSVLSGITRPNFTWQLFSAAPVGRDKDQDDEGF